MEAQMTAECNKASNGTHLWHLRVLPSPSLDAAVAFFDEVCWHCHKGRPLNPRSTGPQAAGPLDSPAKKEREPTRDVA